MNKPVTNEYAAKMLSKALDEGNEKEIDKWAMIIRSNVEMRLRVKKRRRELRQRLIQRTVKRHSTGA